MPVICQLCNQSFEKQITNSHLKHAHGTTTAAYKEQFGAKSLIFDCGRENYIWLKK